MTIADLTFDDYEHEADVDELEGADRRRFFELAAERHEAALARQLRDSERYYGVANAHTGRLRSNKSWTAARNRRVARALRAAAAELEEVVAS